MEVIAYADFKAGVEARLRAAGVRFTPSYVESLRNKGGQRTPEKREALRQIDGRAAEAGVSPLPAYY